MSRGNNSKIPFVGVTRGVSYDDFLPLSPNCVQSVKKSTGSVSIRLRAIQEKHVCGGGGGGVGVVYPLISDLHNLKKSSDTKAYELIVMYCNVLYWLYS